MKSLLLLATLLLGACNEGFVDPPLPDLSAPMASCGQVDFCLPFLGPVTSAFSQCVLPFEPHGSNSTVAQAYYDCALVAGSTGACATECATKPDLGLEKTGCAPCLKGTCSNGTCSGGACSAEATACGN